MLPGYLLDVWKCSPVFFDLKSQFFFLLWRFSVTARGKISAMFKPCTVMGSAFCVLNELESKHFPSEVEHAAEICRWELWHRSWGKRSHFSSGVPCESCCSVSTVHPSHHGVKQSGGFAETRECGQSRKMFHLFHSLKTNRNFFVKESCSKTPVWWLIAEAPGNLQPGIAEGHSRWAYTILLSQSLRIPKAPVTCCCSPHVAAVTFPYSARPKSLFHHCYSLTYEVDLASTSSQS